MKNLVLLFFIFSAFTAQSQKVTGYWYGQANVEVAGIQNNYLTELIISQKGNKVKGFFGYYFKDVYQSFMVKGSFDPKTRKLVINDIPIIYFKTNSTMNSVDCITSFYGTLRVSKVKTELSGYFYRDKKYTYTCPDLRVNYTLYTEAKVTDSIFKDMSSTRSYWKPQPPVPDVVLGNNAQAEKEMLASVDAVSGTRKPADKENKNTITTKDNKVLAPPVVAAPIESKAAPLTVDQPVSQADIVRIKENFKKRKLIVSKQIEVSSDSVRLSFYDNAEVDGDSISVFLNGNLVVAHQELNERAFNLYLQLDSSREFNEVSMFAENLGKYPPNTALMVLSDGDKRYETFLSSDFKGSATIRLKLRKNAIAGNN
jgi:hypothetical protein